MVGLARSAEDIEVGLAGLSKRARFWLLQSPAWMC